MSHKKSARSGKRKAHEKSAVVNPAQPASKFILITLKRIVTCALSLITLCSAGCYFQPKVTVREGSLLNKPNIVPDFKVSNEGNVSVSLQGTECVVNGPHFQDVHIIDSLGVGPQGQTLHSGNLAPGYSPTQSCRTFASDLAQGTTIDVNTTFRPFYKFPLGNPALASGSNTIPKASLIG